ncbi:MAG TPA: hypothetical protein VFL13_11220 [Candidatus Baltobacteraceae bacterium]|nr:hypothetical protein [Candidatus Baltobacteraceae bacterium]
MRLVLLSFVMLFVELALIRWLGSNIVYLSYFSNFVLLGSFLGIGAGFLRGKARTDLFPWAAPALAFLVTFVLIFPVQIDRSGSQLIYFGGVSATGLPMYFTLPLIFALVAIVMAAIAQGVARTFVQFEPLEAYRLDILGSLAGIVAFSLLSFLQWPPVAWGLVAALAFVILYGRSLRLLQAVSLAGLTFVLLHESLNPSFFWSPYYKIAMFDAQPKPAKAINVNGIPHQIMEPVTLRRKLEPLYFEPYRRVQHNPLRNVLIIGAGNGGDVAIALAAGAQHVDAVEIDPRIYRIGRDMNPDRPYQNPRVAVHINDGRAFLQQTSTHYDLILFALPDSLVLVSGQSSLRLESYLFTIESMATAREKLAPGGAFAMYNYYREDWLIDRLAGTLQTAYGHAPCVDSTGTIGRFAVLTIGRDAGSVRCPHTWTPSTVVTAPADDDHPFVYLRTRSIPPMYLITIAGILLASLLLVRTSGGQTGQMARYADLACMGAAFMLLETKTVVQFALLFGTTWFVNALVFFGILASVFAAVEVTRRVRPAQNSRLYLALLAALAAAWLVPQESLLALPAAERFLCATALAFAPIFLANLIFAERFKAVGSSTIAFGANLLGAMAGGILEYSSLILGYHSLLIIVALLYGCAFVLVQPAVLKVRQGVSEIPATTGQS